MGEAGSNCVYSIKTNWGYFQLGDEIGWYKDGKVYDGQTGIKTGLLYNLYLESKKQKV